MLRFVPTSLVLLCVLWVGGGVRAQDQSGKPAQPDKGPLPRVLILGDSISLGYTASVRKRLEGKAEVLRPRENCQHTAYGLEHIKTWLGDGKWDVIHFNWGIWDTHMLDAANRLVRDETRGDLHMRHTPKQFRENLTRLVAIMEKTGAKLIWASTTPIMSRQGPRFDDIKKFNAVTEEIMKERKIAINDLYAAVLPKVKEWQSADKVHLTAQGSDQLGKLVSNRILEVLQKKGKE